MRWFNRPLIVSRGSGLKAFDRSLILSLCVATAWLWSLILF